MSGQRVGYARVSTRGQSLEIQLEKLNGCDEIFQEKMSGAKKRPELERALQYVRKGDTLVCTKLDRLGRSVIHLAELSQLLMEKGVALDVIDESIDTSTPIGRLTFHLMSAIGEFERERILERIEEGKENARKNGVKFGRKPTIKTEVRREVVRKMALPGASATLIAREYGLGRATVYRITNADGGPTVKKQTQRV
jgi:DNA invertase Pin-like site-specific DNA recombinase